MKLSSKYALSFAALLAISSVGHGQFATDPLPKPGLTLPDIFVEDANLDGVDYGVAAQIRVTFGGTFDTVTGDGTSNGLVGVEVFNMDTLFDASPADSSKLLQFFLMKPVLLDDPKNVVAMGGADQNAALVNDPNSWILSNQLSSALQTTLGYGDGNDSYKYFGMTTTVQIDPLTNPDTVFSNYGQFFFYFSDLVGDFNPYDWYRTDGEPIAFVRWQSISVDGDGDFSAKGLGWGDPDYDPLVPEPSEVALLAMLGMGGLLYVRRRFIKK